MPLDVYNVILENYFISLKESSEGCASAHPLYFICIMAMDDMLIMSLSVLFWSLVYICS